MKYLIASICLFVPSIVVPAYACNIEMERCRPNGTANERIGCDQNKAVRLANKLEKTVGSAACNVFKTCQMEFTGGGSGGHADRVECYLRKLEGLKK